MSCNLVIIPTEQGVGSSAIHLGLRHALEQCGYSVASFYPFRDAKISQQQLQEYILNDKKQELLEDIMKALEPIQAKADFVLVEGFYTRLHPDNEYSWFVNHVDWFNQALTRAIVGSAIIIARPVNNDLYNLEEKIKLAINDLTPELVLGVLVTKLDAPVDASGNIKFSLLDEMDIASLTITHDQIAELTVFKEKTANLLGTIKWTSEMNQPRISDLMLAINVPLLNELADTNRRIKRISYCSPGINNLIEDLVAGTLIVTSVDRADVIMAASLAEAKGIKLAGLLLAANHHIPQETLWFCYTDGTNALPIYANQDYRKSISLLFNMRDLELNKVASDDVERIELVKRVVSKQIDIAPIEAKLTFPVTKKLSPAAFRYFLVKAAKKAHKRIVLPEGDEIRTLEAAIYCHNEGIADCVLIGNLEKINQMANSNNFKLPTSMQIFDPNDVAPAYVDKLVELRKGKNLSKDAALELLTTDVNYLGTMMVYNGEVDGLVSGARNTTAATVRPALQIIKTSPGNLLVSSVFFMCLEEQVLLYGDCAINPNPTADQLADIAIQSADTAVKFNIEARVAMISYSTGESGQGEEVDKVRLATKLVRKKRPDIIIDGPLQYDAAMIKSVAATKAPNSPVAGKATICIFPDLNTGNTTYKAVQRSANVLSIGPMLQGLNKPVNDLSRGATIDDIIYTIAITAIQS